MALDASIARGNEVALRCGGEVFLLDAAVGIKLG
jgi:hypothetical protein